jgi:alpha-1,2-glucosyltransferase
MDEIFHIPQTWEICSSFVENRSIQWDAKITTPPGLYYSAIGLTLTNGCITPRTNANDEIVAITHSIFWLRATSALYWICVFYLTQAICAKRGADEYNSQYTAWLVFTLPPGFFFSSMFYTDAGSVFFLLLGWLACLTDHPPPQYFFKKRMEEKPPSFIPKPSKMISPMACAMSMWFRQTNIIWVCFIIGSVAVTRLERHNPKSLRDLIICIRHEFSHILIELWPLISTVVGFVIQLLIHMRSTGGSIVLGDQNNHTVTPHFAQLCYFFVFACFASGAAWNYKLTIHAIMYIPIRWIITVTVFFAALIHGFTITHPFLLADNRHFTFYIWSKLIRKNEWNKFLLVPIYTWSFFVLLLETAKTVTVSLESIGFLACLAASVVPLPLVEPRYFITPCIVLLILMSKRPIVVSNSLIFSTAYVAVMLNWICIGIVGYLFWFRPFVWVDGSEGRFMW